MVILLVTDVTHFSAPQDLGSLGFAVMHRQFWRQFDLLGKSCRPPAVQLLG
jgi:hypothetical protein